VPELIGATACSLCAQPSTDHFVAAWKPALTCGLCGGLISRPVSDQLRCQLCGDIIRSAAEGLQLCDGTILHTLCKSVARGE
jgi:hypothetical protein